MTESSLFESIKPIDTSSLADKVESNIVELLVSKQLKVGDTIPKELELAQALGVSRTVVREALTRLRMMGIVETKKKKGTVITSPDIFTLLNKSLNPYILDSKTLKDIFELRLVLEIGMADLLYARITKEDIKQLREIVLTDPVDSQYQYSDIDFEIRFHSKLYKITQNETLLKFQKLLFPIFNYVHQSGLLTKIGKEKVYITHASLVDILEKGNPEKFRNAMRMHLENHFERIFSIVPL